MSSSEQTWAFDVPYELLLEIHACILWITFKAYITALTIIFLGPFAFMLQFRLGVIQTFCTTTSLELFLEALLVLNFFSLLALIAMWGS